MLEGVWNRKSFEASLELGGGWSLRDAEGVRGQSWQNSETALEQKTGRPLTGIGKQNRSREEREKGENKRKIGNKGSSPDTSSPEIPLKELTQWLATHGGLTLNCAVWVKGYIQCRLLGNTHNNDN